MVKSSVKIKIASLFIEKNIFAKNIQPIIWQMQLTVIYIELPLKIPDIRKTDFTLSKD